MYAKRCQRDKKTNAKVVLASFMKSFLSACPRAKAKVKPNNDGRLPELIVTDILATACQYISPLLFFNDYFPKT
jgi:hypothetical protein